MKRSSFAIVAVYLFSTTAFCNPNTKFFYESADLGSGRWQYTYDVKNISLSVGIKEFTIWFNKDLYDNLAIVTLDPLASNWDELIWQPEPALHDDGGYDALTKKLNIGVGEHVYGFAVSFDWLGISKPGSQFYQIINPVTYEAIDSGWTVPEPGTLILFSLGGLLCRRIKSD